MLSGKSFFFPTLGQQHCADPVLPGGIRASLPSPIGPIPDVRAGGWCHAGNRLWTQQAGCQRTRKARGSRRTAEPCQERCCQQHGRDGRSAPPSAFRKLAHHLQPTGKTRARGRKQQQGNKRYPHTPPPRRASGCPSPQGLLLFHRAKQRETRDSPPLNPPQAIAPGLPAQQDLEFLPPQRASAAPSSPRAAPAWLRNGGVRGPGRSGRAAPQPAGSHARPGSYPVPAACRECRCPRWAESSREGSGRGHARCQAASGNRTPPLLPAETRGQVSSYGARPWRGRVSSCGARPWCGQA